jgi:hypothetical protein
MSKYISIKSLAKFHQLHEQILLDIIEFEIVPIKKRQQNILVNTEDLEVFERAIRLYHDLGVNLQGVDIICNMHKQIIEMQEELKRLKVN